MCNFHNIIAVPFATSNEALFGGLTQLFHDSECHVSRVIAFNILSISRVSPVCQQTAMEDSKWHQSHQTYKTVSKILAAGWFVGVRIWLLFCVNNIEYTRCTEIHLCVIRII